MMGDNRKEMDLAAHIEGDFQERASRTLSLLDDRGDRIRVVVAVATSIGAWACGTITGMLAPDGEAPKPSTMFRWLAEMLDEAAVLNASDEVQ